MCQFLFTPGEEPLPSMKYLVPRPHPPLPSPLSITPLIVTTFSVYGSDTVICVAYVVSARPIPDSIVYIGVELLKAETDGYQAGLKFPNSLSLSFQVREGLV